MDRTAIEVAPHRCEQLYHKYVNLFEFSPVGFLVIDDNGLIQELNLAASTLFNIPRNKLVGRRVTDFIHRDDKNLFFRRKNSCRKKKAASAFELKMKNASNHSMDIRLQLSPIQDQFHDNHCYSLALTDISELVQLSSSANLQQQCLELINSADNRTSLLKDHVQLIKTSLCCDAVGIRMRNVDGGIPYLVYEGFSREWIETGSQVCPKLEACLCTRVINGDAESGKPFFTPKGSFYINGIIRFLNTAWASEIEVLKSDCPMREYESMVLIPIVVNDSICGLIHLADHREDRFPSRVVETLEQVAFRLGMAIHRFNLQEHLLQSQNTLDELSRHLLTMQEEEQRRIAIELHDGCGQNLNALKLHIKCLQNRLPTGADNLNDQCNALLTLTDSIIDEIRSIAHGLKPAALETLGLVPATRQLFRELREQYEVYIEKHIDLLSDIDAPSVQVCLYRIFQEALSNIIKHAQATWILFAVRHQDESLHIVITDNGIGFDTQPPCKGADGAHGMGLQAMALRCRMIGAEMNIESQSGRGTRLSICLPYPEKALHQ